MWNKAGSDISIEFGNNNSFDVDDVVDVDVAKTVIGRRDKDWVAARNDELTIDNILDFLKSRKRIEAEKGVNHGFLQKIYNKISVITNVTVNK